MRVLVIGSGVIGTTTAWYLAKAGFEVTVVDRQAGPSQETSFANAGQISPGYASPWAAPGVPMKAFKWLFQKHSPLSIKPGLDPRQYIWLMQMLANCDSTHYAQNKARMVRLSEYSRDCLNELVAATGIEYEGRHLGTMQVFRTQEQLDSVAKDVAVLDEYGVPYELLSASGITHYEPALAASGVKLAGALRLPNDQTGDCNVFTQRLAAMAQAAGVEFRYKTRVEAIEGDGHRVTGVRLNGKIEKADRYVLAAGSYSPKVVARLGLKLPVYPLKGYSLTLPVIDEGMAPISTVMDETYKVAITRFDSRIRVGGMAELAGFDLSLNQQRRKTLEMVLRDLYPKGGAFAQVQFWAGLRPATPDGTPIVGGTPLSNLYTNTGHGTLGWTMACGSGRYLADLMTGQAPAVSIEGLSMFRYSKTPSSDEIARCAQPVH